MDGNKKCGGYLLKIGVRYRLLYGDDVYVIHPTRDCDQYSL